MEVATLIGLTVVVPFMLFFVYSVGHEILRRRREGPPDDPREFFHFDEEAPSYEEPPEPEPEEPEDPEAEPGDAPETTDPDTPPEDADPREEKP